MKENLLRVGEIPYTNCCNIYYYLKRKYPVHGVEYLRGTPAELNALLRSAEIDLCLSSSIEYACLGNAEYLILPGFCIGARGAMPSIRLFSKSPIENLDGAGIALTDESATTVVLLKIILARFFGFSNEFTTSKTDLEDGLRSSDAVLLIGDRALASGAAGAQGIYSYDLSSIWQERTGTPFVFALWTLRKAVLQEKRGALVAGFYRALELSHRELETPDEELIREVLAERPFMTTHQLKEYWSLISYELTGDYLKGLELFYSMALRTRQIPELPEIELYKPQSFFQ
ncbi:MAG: menaquinone biosynthesis protein [Gemmatimonadota bacterium]|nr:menaquinone biosynthesis protein [Gemmatimonadota bacterium]